MIFQSLCTKVWRLVGHVGSTSHVFLPSSDIIVTERLNSRPYHFYPIAMEPVVP